MHSPAGPEGRIWSRAPKMLVLALVIQITAAVFIVLEAFVELLDGAGRWHPVAEAPIALALCIGIAFVMRDLAAALHKTRDQQRKLELVAEEFTKVVTNFFDRWNLTPSEREVAYLSLKGHEVKEIARLRQTAEGTIRAQLTRIYEKSGTANRAQLASIFMNAVMGDDLVPRRGTGEDQPG